MQESGVECIYLHTSLEFYRFSVCIFINQYIVVYLQYNAFMANNLKRDRSFVWSAIALAIASAVAYELRLR